MPSRTLGCRAHFPFTSRTNEYNWAFNRSNSAMSPVSSVALSRHHLRFQLRRSLRDRAIDAGDWAMAVWASRYAAGDVFESRLVERADHGLGHARRVGEG